VWRLFCLQHAVTGLTKTAAKENGHCKMRTNTEAPSADTATILEPGSCIMEEAAVIKRVRMPNKVSDVVAFLLGPRRRMGQP
jgi:NAD(P)-dependent dehydrogenase (short-subunit alcohol dehydrogenase family)